MLEWMLWEPESLLGLGVLIVIFIISAILDLKKKSTPRKGFLPFPTTRGERIFLAIMCVVISGLLAASLTTDMFIILTAALIGVVLGIIILLYG